MKKIFVLFGLFLSLSAARVDAVDLRLAGGLVTTTGTYGGSFLAGVAFPIKQSKVQMLAETGVMFGSGTGLPILFTVLYRITGESLEGYIGGSLGPVIGVGGAGVFDGGPTADRVRLAMLLRPGLRFKAGDGVHLITEMPIGGLTGLFYIGPMFGVSIAL